MLAGGSTIQWLPLDELHGVIFELFGKKPLNLTDTNKLKS
jgi:hypothetical protein